MTPQEGSCDSSDAAPDLSTEKRLEEVRTSKMIDSFMSQYEKHCYFSKIFMHTAKDLRGKGLIRRGKNLSRISGRVKSNEPLQRRLLD